MKYNEFIHVNEKFAPVVDLEKDEGQYLPIFIPNDKFKKVLGSAIDSLDNPLKKNPVWLQGTYGTGKSHATSVVKHLLCDEKIEIDLKDNQLTAKLETFRNKSKVFPVVLKGTSTIGDSKRFNVTVQTAVKEALKKNDMQVTIQSDFENMIVILNESVTLTDEDLKGTMLEAYSKEEIISRLENEESEILLEVEEILLNKKRINPVIQEGISE